MHLIGLDLAFSNVGVAECWISCGALEVYNTHTVTTTPKESILVRSEELYTKLCEVITQYPQDKLTVSVEVPAGSQSAHAAKALSAATAVLGCLKATYPLVKFIELSTREIKRLVGHKEVKGTARKKLNIQKAVELYPTAPFKRNKAGEVLSKEEHVADAVLLAHIALERI